MARARLITATPRRTPLRWWRIIGAVGVTAAGLAWGLARGGYKWHLYSKSQRLRTEGVPVTAVVSGRQNTVGRGGGTDTIQVTYEYRGTQRFSSPRSSGLVRSVDRNRNGVVAPRIRDQWRG